MPTEDADVFVDTLSVDMQHAIIAALLRRQWQLFDTGGESIGRSMKAALCEAAQDVLDWDGFSNYPHVHAAYRACDADPRHFLTLVNWCKPLSKDTLGYVSSGDPSAVSQLQSQQTALTEMRTLLTRHGWPEDKHMSQF